jgi:lysophospholipase L1-like esterase
MVFFRLSHYYRWLLPAAPSLLLLLGCAERLGLLLAVHQPDLVIVELGGNDFLRKTQATRVKEFLRGIIREDTDNWLRVFALYL